MEQRLIGAIEAGGTKFVLALAREDGEVLARGRIDSASAEVTFPQMCAFFRQASAEHGPIAAFGVGSFGPFDNDPASPGYGTITTTPKTGWPGANFIAALAEFGVPVVCDTDVNAAAIGEGLAGAGRGCGLIAYATVGTGIGVGLVRDGAVLGGFGHYEAGHVPVARAPGDTFAGACRVHHDCVEGMASGTAIRARWGGELAGKEQIELIAHYLAQLAAVLLLTHMPERLIFGGGVMQVPGLIEALRRAAEARFANYIHSPHLDPGLERYIVTPGLGNDAGITGAIALGRKALT